MAKSPLAGLAKRRLAKDVSQAEAVRFYRACLSHTVMRLSGDARWQTLLAVTPDADLAAPFWPSGIPRLPQGRGDLGRRMQSLFDRLPPGPAIVIGSDIPGIRRHHIAVAFRLLGNADAVLGPAKDGGYWLIGLRRRPRVLRPFVRVRWSSPHALADTLKNLSENSVVFAETLSDVDGAETYRNAQAKAARLV
jgi:hypothetical protein